MRFCTAVVLASATSTLAQTPDFDSIHTPKKDEIVAAGSAFTITWDAPAKYAKKAISIELIGGETQSNLHHVASIASGVDNSAKTFTWPVKDNLGDKRVYGLAFRLENNPEIMQYSSPFQIKNMGERFAASRAASLAKSHGSKTVDLSITNTSILTTAACVTGITTDTKARHHNNVTIAKNTTSVTSFKSNTDQLITVPTTIAPTAATTTAVVLSPTAAASCTRVGYFSVLSMILALYSL
ncbi:hypothetical protein QQS21_004111 [Conoideocrella luteorostrata]|uniref:Yeast cell wall synthesis Kre9/Knh1-like N-terminal domain-containing protein n=1 Tax=Conoideocrella luteorostrata TaxID=1105319 RepID=A0AAJ0CT31_9HYPO|nr:hypothetical protein QQS21_004111 [Conoideocrella luteorostrata]